MTSPADKTKGNGSVAALVGLFGIVSSVSDQVNSLPSRVA